MRKLALATTIVICLLVTASAGAAKPPRGFYGVISANDPSAQEFQRLGAGNLGTLRTNVYWGAVQPYGPLFYDWSRYDAIVGGAAEQGIRVLPTVYGSPGWAADRPQYPPGSDHLGDFQAFARAAAERYGPGGTFWLANPTIPQLPITDWQLWNEVNSPSFWLPKPRPKDYVTLLSAFNAGIKSADPNGRIILSGLFLTPAIKNGVTLVRYLTGLYRLKARGLFDAAAVHPYATTPERALLGVEAAREVMHKFKDKRKPIWLTEVGWATGGQKTPLTVSPKKQAAYLKGTFKLMAANRNKEKIAGVIWYSLRDIGGSIWFNHTGLFTEPGAPKPAWFAFVGQTGGTP